MRRTVLIMLGIAVLIAALIVILQVPPISIRRLFVGERVLGGGQFLFLEFLAGSVTSMIITAIAVLPYKRLSTWIAGLSVVMQIIWMGISVKYLENADSFGSFFLRIAEPTGILLGAVLAVLLVRGLAKNQESQSKQE